MSITAGSFMIVPRHVLGKGFIPPSDKLNLASIGAGGKGYTDILHAYNNGQNNVVALCDVDEAMSKKTREKFPDAKYFSDFRVMLDTMKGTIDGVTISTPDHTHGVATMAAMENGVHVYVQKPLTHNIYEARKLTETARRLKIISQMGNQGASCPDQKLIQKWVNEKKLGKIDQVYAWTDRPVWPQGIPVPSDKPTLPSSMNKENWDLFIGPAKYVDYHPLYHPFKWRGWWNFGTGALGDMGCHILDVAFNSLNLGYALEVEAHIGRLFTKDWVPENVPEGCPISSTIQMKFAATNKTMKPVTLTWFDGGIKPFRPEFLPESIDIPNNGIMIMGSKGMIIGNLFGEKAKLIKKNGEVISKPKDWKTGNPFESLPEFGHQVSWCQAIKDGYGSAAHKALTSDFEKSGPLTEAVLMGNLAIRSYQLGDKGRKRLLWDGKNMRITNFDEANQFVKREYRPGWEM